MNMSYCDGCFHFIKISDEKGIKKSSTINKLILKIEASITKSWAETSDLAGVGYNSLLHKRFSFIFPFQETSNC